MREESARRKRIKSLGTEAILSPLIQTSDRIWCQQQLAGLKAGQVLPVPCLFSKGSQKPNSGNMTNDVTLLPGIVAHAGPAEFMQTSPSSIINPPDGCLS